MHLLWLTLLCTSVLLPQEPDKRRPVQGTLKVGEVAPGFALRQLGTSQTVKLDSLRDKPVVLVFGSCT